MRMRCRGAIRASIQPSAHVATFRRLPAATCPPRPGLSPSSDVHHQNASRATCAATTELASVVAMFPCPAREHRCTRASERGGDASKGAALSGLEHTWTEASSVVGRTRAVDAEASSCHWPRTRSGLEHTWTEASSVVGRARAVDAEASSCLRSSKKAEADGMPSKGRVFGLQLGFRASRFPLNCRPGWFGAM